MTIADVKHRLDAYKEQIKKWGVTGPESSKTRVKIDMAPHLVQNKYDNSKYADGILTGASNQYLNCYFRRVRDCHVSLDKISIMGLPLNEEKPNQATLLWPGEPLSLIAEAITRLSGGDHTLAFSQISRACDQVHNFLLRQYPTTLLCIMDFLELSAWDSHLEIANLRKHLLHFIFSMAVQIFGRDHPFSAVLSILFFDMIPSGTSQNARACIIKLLLAFGFRREHLSVSNALNRVGITPRDGIVDENKFQGMMGRSPSLLDLSYDVALQQMAYLNTWDFDRETENIDNLPFRSMEVDTRGTTSPAGVDEEEFSGNQCTISKAVSLLRLYKATWNKYPPANAPSPPLKQEKKCVGRVSALSSVSSEVSISTPQSFSELSEPPYSISTPQTSVSPLQNSTDSPSYSELSFVNGSNDSNIENMLFERDLPFLQELAERILIRCLKARLHTSIVTTATGREDSSTTSVPSNLAMSTSSTSGNKASKRARKAGGEGDDCDDKGNEPNEDPPKKRICKDAPRTITLFACPYWKHDPERYSENNLLEKEKSYRGCSSIYLKDISRLKQHLWRVHRKPDYFCCICFSTFESQILLFAHTKKRECQPKEDPFQERMSDEQCALVKRRNKNGDHVEQWYGIWGILFPDQLEPESPYAEKNGVVDHFAALFRWFGPEEFLNMLRDRRDRGGSPLQLSTRLIALEAFERALPGFLRLVDCPFTSPPRETGGFEPAEPEPLQVWTRIPGPPDPLNVNALCDETDNLSNATPRPLADTNLPEWWRTLQPEAPISMFMTEDPVEEPMFGATDPDDPMGVDDDFDLFKLSTGSLESCAGPPFR